jgi:hypothetical protein
MVYPFTPKEYAMTHDDVRQRVVASAQRIGIQLNEAELERWMTSMTAATTSVEPINVDERSGVYGHKVSMLDFDPKELARFRAIARVVEIPDIPGVVETALALSGSAAQSKIQTHPGDCDYFERVNIMAPTRADACRILATVMRQKVTDTYSGPTYQMIEIKFGNYPYALIRDGKPCAAGSPISWLPDDVARGFLTAQTPAGATVTVAWLDVAHDPGWCKLDWVVIDTTRNQLSNASNMLDVTWEAPDGTITPLDGYLDGYFQEVYLDLASQPIFNKLVKQVSSDVLDDYVASLQREVKKYVSGAHPNYGKAAKRMYNVFRLTGQYESAALLRELFDEPAAILYQVHALTGTVQDVVASGGAFDTAQVLDQIEDLIMMVIRVLEGEKELEIVRYMLRLHRFINQKQAGASINDQIMAAQAEILNLVNNFFYAKMTALPTIKTYIDELSHA